MAWWGSNEGRIELQIKHPKGLFKKHVDWSVDWKDANDRVDYILGQNSLMRKVFVPGNCYIPTNCPVETMRPIRMGAGDVWALELSIQMDKIVITSNGKILDEFKRPNPSAPLGRFGFKGDVEVKEEPSQDSVDLDSLSMSTGKINSDLRNLCQGIGSTLRKYPFQNSSRDDAKLEELGVFAPSSGAIWKFQAQSLAEILVKDATGWKVKDPSNKLLPTQELLNFLNRAQAISDALYAGGVTSPHFSYTFRPKMDNKDLTVTLDVDGQHHDWTNSLQQRFTWPAAQGTTPGATGWVRKGALSVSFASRDGMWGIFRIIGDAEPRSLSSGIIEWKYARGKDGGRVEAINPPVRLEFIKTPGEIDLFSPNVFEELRCPGKAIQAIQ